jgi:transcriptional regulator
MYNLSYYKETDREVLLQFMRQYSFAMLIGCANNIPAVTQIPLLIEQRAGKLFLIGHFMRQTDHHKALEQNPNALFVFTGPHTYVSASLYSNTQTASTWNYMTVHARGTMQFLDNDGLLEALEKLTDHYEGKESSASFNNLPKEYLEKLSPAIIGFEVEVKEIDTVYKLSQNRDEASYRRIIDHLEKGGEDSQKIALEMKNRKEKLFQHKQPIH